MVKCCVSGHMPVVEDLGHMCNIHHLFDIPNLVIIFVSIVIVILTYCNSQFGGFVSYSRQRSEIFYHHQSHSKTLIEKIRKISANSTFRYFKLCIFNYKHLMSSLYYSYKLMEGLK